MADHALVNFLEHPLAQKLLKYASLFTVESSLRSFLEDPSKITETDRTDCGLRRRKLRYLHRRAERMDCGQKAGGEAVASSFDLSLENEEVFGEGVMATLNLYCWSVHRETAWCRDSIDLLYISRSGINVAMMLRRAAFRVRSRATARCQRAEYKVLDQQFLRAIGRSCNACSRCFRADGCRPIRGSFCRG